ncbi:MAG TPA: VanZ family protein [Gemmataceae bacterium]|nr:VanZ family protein [Gemmataceae bacterium]
MKRRWWVVWLLCLAVWTVALTTTFPVYIHRALLPQDFLGVPVAKILHVSAYAFLAGFAVLICPAGTWRWLIVLLLLEHGVATEWIQGFVPERTSSVNDIVIDHGGVALGVLLTWPWRRRGRG